MKTTGIPFSNNYSKEYQACFSLTGLDYSHVHGFHLNVFDQRQPNIGLPLIQLLPDIGFYSRLFLRNVSWLAFTGVKVEITEILYILNHPLLKYSF